MADFYSRLSENELKMISYIRETSTETEQSSGFGRGTYCTNQHFLRYWEYEKNRNPLIASMFKNQLILSKRVHVSESEEEIRERVNNILRGDDFYAFYHKLLTALKYYNEDLWSEHQIHWPEHINYDLPNSVFHELNHNPDTKLSSVEMFSIRDMIYNFCNTSDYYISNIYDGPTFTVAISKEKNYTLQVGAKTTKALLKLSKAIISYCRDTTNNDSCCKEWEELIERMRISLSTIRNQASFNTQLCLSIHPLDYLTASENYNGWRSCMNIWDGEYRRGVIEMMNSPYVIVAYTPSEHEEVRLSTNFWNSKKWREFFIVHPTEGIFGIKGYPYWNSSLEDATLSWIKELLPNQEYTDIIEYHIHEAKDAIITMPVNMCCGPAMYNDFYGNNTYRCIVSTSGSLFKGEKTYIDYSGVTECLVCGEVGEFDNEASLTCYECCEYHTCCKCGETIMNTHDLVIFNGEDYCCSCYENLPNCECCGEVYDIDSTGSAYDEIAIGISDEPNEYIPSRRIVDRDERRAIRSFCICPDCRDRLIKDAHNTIANAPTHSTWWQYVPIIRPSQFRDHDAYQTMMDLLDPEIAEFGEELYQENMRRDIEAQQASSWVTAVYDGEKVTTNIRAS